MNGRLPICRRNNHPLIADALREYSESADAAYDPALAKGYAGYAIARIRKSDG